jgi:hypothetical protein
MFRARPAGPASLMLVASQIRKFMSNTNIDEAKGRARNAVGADLTSGWMRPRGHLDRANLRLPRAG